MSLQFLVNNALKKPAPDSATARPAGMAFSYLWQNYITIMVKVLLATLVGTIVYFLFGWLVFEGILGEYMSANTTQIAGFKKTETESSMLMLLVSCAAYALLLAILMRQWAQVGTFLEGLKMGAVTGLLVATMTDSYWYSTSHFFNGFQPMLADIAAAGLTVGVMGGAMGWFLGYRDKS